MRRLFKSFKRFLTRSISLAALVMAPVIAEGGETPPPLADGEVFVDIDAGELTEAIYQATATARDKLDRSRLTDEYAAIAELLEAPNVDKRSLADGMDRLLGELHAFDSDFDTMTDPMWDAQQKIGGVVDNLRLLLARAQSGKPSKKTQAILDNYDTRLRQLAHAIRSETDPVRAERLRMVFANLLALKDLVSKVASVDIGPARDTAYARIVRALEGLESQLTASIFALEKTRVVVSGQIQFVQLYRDILEALMFGDEVGQTLGNMTGSQLGFGQLTRDLSEMAEQGDDFATAMDAFAGRLAEQIESETADMSAGLHAEAASTGLDIESALDHYAPIDKESSQ